MERIMFGIKVKFEFRFHTDRKEQSKLQKEVDGIHKINEIEMTVLSLHLININTH